MKDPWMFPNKVVFMLTHMGLLGLFLIPISFKFAILVLLLFILMGFGYSAGYHRYFSHRSFKVDRITQFFLAFLAQSTNQGGVLEWTRIHAQHHRYTDQEEDPHSPVIEGLWWAYLGWILRPGSPSRVPEPSYFARFKELRILNQFSSLCTVTLGIAVFLAGKAIRIGGWTALTGLCLALALSSHSTYILNFWGHLWGSRRFETRDNSHNSFVLALLTHGEGWHNNHHRHPHSAHFGSTWWEIDTTYYILKGLALVGLVKDLVRFPETGTVSTGPSDPG
jgi:stearoyl-CoA desaturase (delta-9 desaturase)